LADDGDIAMGQARFMKFEEEASADLTVEQCEELAARKRPCYRPDRKNKRC
jgi:hypothetical protein